MDLRVNSRLTGVSAEIEKAMPMINPHAPLTRTGVKLAFIGFLACFASGCGAPSVNCGSWAFNGTVQSDPNSFPLTSSFTFTPATCGSNCKVQTDAMIQMTLVYDTVERMNVYATSADQDRADANGWNIDRVNGAGYGWYSLLNDGKTFYSFWETTGSNNTADTLNDRPGGWANNTFFYAVDASVCFKSDGSDTCTHKILGYYFWSWVIENNGNAAEFLTAPGWQPLEAEFQSALAAWNKWAPNSGAESSGIQGQPVLPNAVAFPALSNL